jgi:replicative DNA helicase
MSKPDTRENIARKVLGAAPDGIGSAPSDIEAEEALLGQLLVDGSQLNAAILERLGPDDFFIIAYGWVFDAMLSLHSEGLAVDTLTIADRLRVRDQLKEIVYQAYTGPLALQQLAENSLGHWGVRAYARLIRQKAEERRLLAALDETATDVFRGERTAYEKWGAALERLIAVRPHVEGEALLIGADAIDYYERAVERDRHNPVWYPLPWKAFEQDAPVYKPGDVVVIAGPEGSGKSAMAFNMAQFYAEHLRSKVFCLFTEMDMQNVLSRQVAANSVLSYRRLLTPEDLENSEVIELYRTGERLREWVPQMAYAETGAISAKELVAHIKRVVDTFGVQVVVIDGFNDLTYNIPHGQTQAGVIHNFMAYLETFARENELFVIGTVQLNRDGDALGSGAYKRKASLYLKIEMEMAITEESLTYQGVTYKVLPGQNSMKTLVKIEKNRRGPTGRKLPLWYLGADFRWIDPPSWDEAPFEIDLEGF